MSKSLTLKSKIIIAIFIVVIVILLQFYVTVRSYYQCDNTNE